MEEEQILDLGCGTDKHKGAIGLDRFPFNGVDMVCDLEKGELPFGDNSFQMVIAHDVLEHLNYSYYKGKDIIYRIFEEIHRILKPNGILWIQVPYFKSYLSCSIDHKRFFSSIVFDWFENISPNEKKMCNVSFRIKKIRFNYIRVPMAGCWNRARRLVYPVVNGIVNPIINLSPMFYEKILSNFLPADEIEVEMVKVK